MNEIINEQNCLMCQDYTYCNKYGICYICFNTREVPPRDRAGGTVAEVSLSYATLKNIQNGSITEQNTNKGDTFTDKI